MFAGFPFYDDVSPVQCTLFLLPPVYSCRAGCVGRTPSSPSAVCPLRVFAGGFLHILNFFLSVSADLVLSPPPFKPPLEFRSELQLFLLGIASLLLLFFPSPLLSLRPTKPIPGIFLQTPQGVFDGLKNSPLLFNDTAHPPSPPKVDRHTPTRSQPLKKSLNAPATWHAPV